MAAPQDVWAALTAGPILFTRFAFPPNAHGYCGPADTSFLSDLLAGDGIQPADFRHAIQAFDGAWPYLELIGGCTGRDPLDPVVVEAYWLGNQLLFGIDNLTWGNSLDDRFRARAGSDWDRIVAGIEAGGVPNHAFHVFCAYPWVGLLRNGGFGQALTVLDQCRVRWGRVVDRVDDRLVVESAPLLWDGLSLSLGDPRPELVAAAVDAGSIPRPGDEVAMHWDYVCQIIDPAQRRALESMHGRHLAIANSQPAALAGRLD